MDKEAIRRSTVAELKALGATNESISRFLVKCVEEAAKLQGDGRMRPGDEPRESAELKAAMDRVLDAYPVIPSP
jgi:hypothetical protein